MTASDPVSVVAIVAAYNEADIIAQTVGDLIHQGVQVYVLDHGSTDGTVAALAPYRGQGLLGVEPLSGADSFAWEAILRRKETLARELAADWFIHHDADEFRESPWPHLDLRAAIARVDALGYNAIDFAVLEFPPTHDNFQPWQDVRDAFRFCEWGQPWDRVQIRCWKRAAGVDLASSGGHEAVFPGRRVFPVRFLLRHYPIRGQAHGERKVFRERRPRFVDAERRRGWHVHYDAIAPGHRFVRDARTLMAYDPDAIRMPLLLRHRGVEELEAVIAAAREEADALRARGAELDATLGRERHEALLVRGELAGQTTALAAARAEGEAVRGELAATATALTAVRADGERVQAELTQARAEGDRLRGELAAAATALAAARAEGEAVRGELAATATALTAARADGERVRAELAGATAALAAAQAEGGRLQGALAAARAAGEALRAELVRVGLSLADRRARVDALEASRSWRWTAPLRVAFRLLGGR